MQGLKIYSEMFPLKKIKEFENEYLTILRTKHVGVLDSLKQGKLTDEVVNTLESVCKDLSDKY